MDTTDFKNLLKNRDLKATSSRVNLLLKIKEYQSAMPYTEIQKAMQKTDRVTLYRTIETLTTHGVIHKAFQKNNDTYYALCGTKCDNSNHQHDHIHFMCTDCDAVTCVQLEKNITISMPEYEIQSVAIHINGICKSCK